VRIHVAFTPAEPVEGPVGVVVDVLRATSTIVQALESGYGRVLCCQEVEEALALRDRRGEGVLGGERLAVLIPGFDLGNSPSEYVEPRGETAILTTTNGTRAIVAAVAQCERVFVASLLNLGAAVAAVGELAQDATVVCAGVKGTFALDDAYCAGRIVSLLDCERTDSAEAAARLTRTFASAEEALGASRSAANLRANGLDVDVAWCARESICAVVPRFLAMTGVAAEIGA
jgi:2-phosphosulfolactate phosphatase